MFCISCFVSQWDFYLHYICAFASFVSLYSYLFVFLAESSLSYLFWGFFLILQELPFFFTFFISAGKFLWFGFIASKNFNSFLNEICARWPFLKPLFVLSIGKTSKIKSRLFEIIPKISAQYLSWGLSNWIFHVFLVLSVSETFTYITFVHLLPLYPFLHNCLYF